ncbi:MAG: Na+/H+ antiporter NhaA [Candidatus Endobugula sp.]|jgi:Na+/H+ antiporter NhaA
MISTVISMITYIIGAVLLAVIGLATPTSIAEIAFTASTEMIMQAQLGVLLALVFAGVAAYAWLSKLETAAHQTIR